MFSLAALIGFASFQFAARSQELIGFVVGSILGGGAFGALGFYHISQVVAVRLAPTQAHRAIAINTLWGAFACSTQTSWVRRWE
ncbi:MAG: hypothetical protein ACR2HR_01350 [Euzebya sp.]